MKLLTCLLTFIVVIGLSAVFTADNASAALTRQTGAGTRSTDAGCIYLDPDRDVLFNIGGYDYNTWGSQFDDNSSSWKCTQAGNSWGYQGALYPGYTYPGEPMLDNAAAITDGYYYGRVGLQNPAGNMTGSYHLELWVRFTSTGAWDFYQKAWLSAVIGGTECSAYPYYNSTTNYDYITDRIYPEEGSSGATWFGQVNNSPYTMLPWTEADFIGRDFQMWLEFKWKVQAANIRVKYMYAVLVPTAAPVIPEGQQVLRPDGDIETFDWTAIPTDDFNDNINDTALYGDGDTTYITTSSGYTLSSFTFSDLDSTFQDRSFNLTLWVIAKTSEESPDLRQLNVGLTSGYYAPDEQEAITTTGYYNYSFSWPFNPGTGQPWTYWEIMDLKVFFSSGGNVSITQAAVIVFDSNYIAPGEDPEGGLFNFKMVSADGIISILAVLGFFGMIATPTISYLQYKNGDEALLAGAHGIYLMMLFFGLFLIGLMVN
jgi:hypothetical protein